MALEFQSTRSARSATHNCPDQQLEVGISIHALREERDWAQVMDLLRQAISIHALREERDSVIWMQSGILHLFQSTRSARSATNLSRDFL